MMVEGVGDVITAESSIMEDIVEGTGGIGTAGSSIVAVEAVDGMGITFWVFGMAGWSIVEVVEGTRGVGAAGSSTVEVVEGTGDVSVAGLSTVAVEVIGMETTFF